MTFRPSSKPKVITSAKMLEKLIEKGRYRDPETKGLYLQVINAQNRSWVLRYQFHGKPRNMGLGPFPLIGLQKARERAREIRRDIKLDNADPLEKRREQQAAVIAERARMQTFRQAAERFYQKASLEWKTKAQRRTFRSSMETYVFPKLGNIDVAAIDTAAVLRVLEPIWQDKPSIAKMLRIRIEKILTMATVGGYRTGDNPARWQGHLAEMLSSHAKIAPTEHHAALPYKELPAFMAKLRAQDSIATRALQFLILTAARRQETLGARWAEINKDARTWTIPASRMKGGREHVVPLSDAAMAILNSVHREDGNPFVFIGAKQGAALSEASLKGILKQLGGGEVTAHGFRSSFRDWAGNETHHPREICEAALSHVVGDATERTYRRETAIEKRRGLMQQWAHYCGGETHEGGKVIPLKRKGA